MSLEALAPDQRAVVQLVLQQERSYDDLAGLLGISPEAVRERAHAGLDRIGGPPGDLTDEERAEIGDYLLGQQSVSRREATRGLLTSSRDARRWANRVADAIEDVARSPLPGIPAEDEEDEEDEEPVTAGTAALATPAGPVSAATGQEHPGGFTEDELEEDEEAEDDEPAGTEPLVAPVRARPRPRPRPTAGRAAATARGPKPDRPRSSMVGGALLIGGVAVILVALIVFLFSGDDEEPASDGAATPTATATPTVQAAGEIPLKSTTGSKAAGSMTIFVSQDGQVAFTIEASNVPQSREGEAYAVWLTGGPRPKRLGFAPTVGEDGKLGVSGPREGDAESFPQDFSRAEKVVVTRETSQDATKPGSVILTGDVPQGSP